MNCIQCNKVMDRGTVVVDLNVFLCEKCTNMKLINWIRYKLGKVTV